MRHSLGHHPDVFRVEELSDLRPTGHIHVFCTRDALLGPIQKGRHTPFPIFFRLDLDVARRTDEVGFKKKKTSASCGLAKTHETSTDLGLPEVVSVNQHALLLHVSEDASELDPVLFIELVKGRRMVGAERGG